jgi:Fibronectin type III domain
VATWDEIWEIICGRGPRSRVIAATARVAPALVTNLRVSKATPTSVALAWSAPVTGSAPIYYAVLMRLHGTPYWSIAATVSSPSAIIATTAPHTSYDFEVMAYNN